MDLRFSEHTPTDDEIAALAAFAPGSPRDRLLPALHAVNDRVGHLSRGAINEIGRRLDTAPADVYGVASFYALFSFEPRGNTVTHVCTDLACLANGVGSDGPFEEGRHASPCLGLCERAPASLTVTFGAEPSMSVSPPDVPPAGAVPQAGDPSLVLLARVGVVDPLSLADYDRHGGYEALRRAVAMGRDQVIAEVTTSGLVGRGGAAFPAGRKWRAVAEQPTAPRFVVCNADESEPGTFKDRVLLEGDPFAVLEAMTIAGYATGSERGFVYLRGEYPRASRHLDHAIEALRASGRLGRDVMGLGFSFDIEVRRGAGAYICGEETAIFNSIEGYRGEPRSKPPFPVEKGLFGRPTLVNNVETLVNVLPIVLRGGAAYATVGTSQSSGPKLFAVSGTVARPGVYEVPFGTTLAALLDLAGGMRPGRVLQAVLLGGAAGSFVGPAELDLPLTFEATRAAGTTLGSGVVLVLDDAVDLLAIVARIAAFFRDESCGQCVPCRVGTVRQHELLARLRARVDARDLSTLRDVGQVMRDASICGLGQTAWNAIESAIDRLDVLATVSDR